jgi:hypothetical protein
MKSYFLIGVCIASYSSLATAESVTVDFQQIQGPGDPIGFLEVRSPYREDGIVLSTDGTWQSPRPGTDFYAGSIGIFNDTLNSESFISSEDNRLFSLKSVDLSRLTTNADVSITFTGHKSDGTDVIASFQRGRFSPLQYTTSSFTDDFSLLTYAKWVTSRNAMQVDNLVVEFVPEPATIGYALAVVALVAVKCLFSKRSRPINLHTAPHRAEVDS